MLTTVLNASLVMLASTAINIDSALPNDKPQFLHHEQAFILSYDVTDENIVLSWDVAPGYYLYQNTIKVKDVPNSALTFTTSPTTTHDEYFGTTLILKEHAEAFFPKAALEQSHFFLTYRGCAEAGLCYPPVTVEITL